MKQVNEVINHFGISRYIGLGVGLGSNVLIRHALRYPGWNFILHIYKIVLSLNVAIVNLPTYMYST